MKLVIEIPKEFEEDFKKDKFKECFGRVQVDLKYFEGVTLCGNYEKETLDMLENAFQNATSSETDESVHGKWIDTTPGYKSGCGYNAHVCSNCHDYYTTAPYEMKFCPTCGAKMSICEDVDEAINFWNLKNNQVEDIRIKTIDECINDIRKYADSAYDWNMDGKTDDGNVGYIEEGLYEAVERLQMLKSEESECSNCDCGQKLDCEV